MHIDLDDAHEHWSFPENVTVADLPEDILGGLVRLVCVLLHIIYLLSAY